MAHSMTGFGRGEATLKNYCTAIVEIKSINNRFKDTRFKMPSFFNDQESQLKSLLYSYFKRGTFDIFVNFSQENIDFDKVDIEKIEHYVSKIGSVLKRKEIPYTANITDFLRPDFYVDRKLEDDDLVRFREVLIDAFEKALLELKSSRTEEGKKLIQVLKEHLNSFKDFFEIIKNNSEKFESILKERLNKRFEDLLNDENFDQARYTQEIVYYLGKIDIQEEIERISLHLEKLEKVLDKKGEIGRQIDFLIQELNRETNTIASKSAVLEISDSVVQMKVFLEKIREQGLNLE